VANYRVVGRSVSRVEGPAKVTGAGRYPADVQLPGMLWAKVLRSPFPHAKILSIDASRARQLSGVHAVLTAAEVPDILIGRMLRDIPLVARHRVRFVGEKVAVVAAESRDIAEKSSPMDVPLIYYVSKATGRPVKMVMNYEEEFLAANPRHPAFITIRSGVKKDGTLVARHGRVVFNCGAYAGFNPNGSISGGYGVGGCYRIPHVLLQVDNVYTNTVPRGHSRPPPPGSPQATFAVESHMDMIAKELELDPLEFRLKNVLQEGDKAPNGHERSIETRPSLPMPNTSPTCERSLLFALREQRWRWIRNRDKCMSGKWLVRWTLAPSSTR